MVGLLAAVAPDHAAKWSTAQAISASFCVATCTAAFLFLSLAAFPRTNGPKGSMVYCGGIAQREQTQFHQDISAVSADDYAMDLAFQCHRNAVIACEKFKWIQRASIALYLSLAPWVVAVWLLYSAPKS
ncbi:Pycsar system effector family protein [Pseudoxanthomonas koreensis]|uniref:Pycsar system effector family protein n=1 Tax=Pseudoxanthomonas koreensis TaxID=266061 RepID=UPI003CCD2629